MAGGLAAIFSVALFFDGWHAYDRWAPVALAVLLLAAVCLLAPGLSPTPHGAVALGALAALLGWAALSLGWAESIENAWTEVDRLALYAATLLVALAVIRTPTSAWLVLGVFAGAVTAVGAWDLLRMLGGSGDRMFIEYRLADPLGYINGQAGAFMMGLWALVAIAERVRCAAARAGAVAGAALLGNLLVLTQARAIVLATLLVGALLFVLPGRIRRTWLLVCIAVGVAAALPVTLDVYSSHRSTGSPDASFLRGVAVAIATSAGATALAWHLVTAGAAGLSEDSRRTLARTGLAVLAAGCVLGGLAIVGDPVQEARDQWHSFRSLDVSQTTTDRQRFTSAGGYRYDLWRISLREFKDHPWRGVGAGNYTTAYFRDRHSPQFVRQPHSIEFQMLGELGLVGFAALLVFVLAVGTSALRPPRAALVRGDVPLAVGGLGVFASWFVHTSVDWLYNIPGLTGIALLGAAIVLARAGPTTSGPTNLRRLAIALPLLVAIAVAATGLSRHYVAALYREQAQRELRRDPAEALSDARRALSLDPHDMAAYYVASAALARRDRYGPARAALLAAARKEPSNYVPWALLGDLATRRGDLAQARRDYGRAHALNPFEPKLSAKASSP